jgi:Putative DNA-binding domain
MPVRFETLEHLKNIITSDIREGVSLEYKSSNIIGSKHAASTISKAVSALANSAGGYFITGIQSEAERPVGLDGGFLNGSRRDWFYQVISTNTYPPLEEFNVLEVPDKRGIYYIVDVPVSINAPHQSSDQKYYKRRGPHSDPMQHYEIEDVRNRPKVERVPFRAEIIAEGFIAVLHLSNIDESNQIEDLRFEIKTNFPPASDAIFSLNKRGLRRLSPSSELSFMLGTFQEILGGNSEAELCIEVAYEYLARTRKYKAVFCIGDYAGSLIMRSPAVKAIEDLTGKIGKLIDALGPLKQLTQVLDRSTDGSGLRLSKRTLSAIRGRDELHDPLEYDYSGYQIVADLSLDEALSVYQIFHGAGTPASKKVRYCGLRKDVREKFEKVFRITPDET